MLKKFLLLPILVIIAFAGESVSYEMAEKAAISHIACCPDFETGVFGHRISKYMPIIDDETGDRRGFIFALDPTGYVITSAHTDIRPILAYSAKNPYVLDNSKANISLNIIKQDLKTRHAALPYMKKSVLERNKQLWADYTSRSMRIFSIYPMALSLGPYLDTQWNQGPPYNIFCPIDPITMARCPIGCVVTAMGQIINYWEWPPSVEFDSTDNYVSDITTPTIEIDATTASIDTIDWNENGHHPGDTTMALFLFACGVSINMQYSDEGSSAWSGDVVDALMEKWDYYTALGIFPSSPSFYSEIALDILEGRVSHLSLDDGGDGHAIVIDGYRESGEYHVNYGWGGAEDGWYFIPDSLPAGFTTATYGIVGIMPPVVTHRPVVDLESQQLNGGYVKLHWNEPSLITEEVLNYNIYRRQSAGGSDEFLGATENRNFIDTAFDELTRYTYSVGAVYDVCGESRRMEIEQYSGIRDGWTRVVRGFGQEASYAVAPYETGGFVAAGKKADFTGENCDLQLIAMDLDGDTNWTKTYGGTENDVAKDILRLSDDGYIIAGWTESYGADGSDIWLLRTDSSGDTLWTKTFGGAEDDSAMSVEMTSDGGYLILGSSGDSLVLIETNAYGDIVSEMAFGSDIIGTSMSKLDIGGYAICGYSSSGPIGGNDIFVMKLNSALDSLWIRYYGGTGLDEAYDIIESDAGEIIVVGKSRSFGMPLYTTTYSLKLDTGGDTLKTSYFGDMKNYSLTDIAKFGDGFVAVGFVDNSSPDLYIQYLNQNLDTLHCHTYGTIGNEEATDVIQLADSGIAISAISYLYGDEDPWLLKVGGELYYGIEEHYETKLPDDMTIRAYPNPFNSAVSIEFPASADIQIFDIRGKLVHKFDNNGFKTGSREVTWEPPMEVTSGVYFIRATDGEKHAVSRLVYIK